MKGRLSKDRRPKEKGTNSENPPRLSIKLIDLDMAEEKADPDVTAVQTDGQSAGTDYASEWAMQPYHMPPENVAFIQSLLGTQANRSAIPIRRLPTRWFAS